MRRLPGFIVVALATALPLALWGAEAIAPQQLVRQALHADLYGLSSQRAALLDQAGGEASKSPLVQGYLGNVRSGNAWLSLADSAKQFAANPALLEYAAQRDQARDDFRGNLTVAEWCERRGLTAQASAHMLRALDFEPDNADLRRRLGHISSGGQWLTAEEAAALRVALVAQAAANEKWLPLVRDLQKRLAGPNRTRRQALRELAEITDPLAIVALEATLGPAGDKHTLAMLETLSAMNDPLRAESLARMGVLSNSADVRESAAKLLGQRDKHSYVPQLLAAMKGPVQSRMALTVEPDGRLLYRHEFVRESQERNELLVVDTRLSRVARSGGDSRETLAQALNRTRREAFRREWQAGQQRLGDEQLNDRIAELLTTATGENIAAVPQSWWTWWNEANEAFNEGSKPVSVRYEGYNVAISDQVPIAFSSGGGSQSPQASPRVECFVAGTPVWTARGEQSIEKIRVGDLVLTQNMVSGQLEHKPVVRTTQRATTQLVRVAIGRDTFDCTGGHLFWVLEQGWVKARDLKTGMVIHTVGGAIPVSSMEEGTQAATFNLVVADHHNYFVGETRCLTHDNTPHRPALLIAPGVEMEK